MYFALSRRAVAYCSAQTAGSGNSSTTSPAALLDDFADEILTFEVTEIFDFLSYASNDHVC